MTKNDYSAARDEQLAMPTQHRWTRVVSTHESGCATVSRVAPSEDKRQQRGRPGAAGTQRPDGNGHRADQGQAQVGGQQAAHRAAELDQQRQRDRTGENNRRLIASPMVLSSRHLRLKR
jgi:hypothetical protein